LAVHKRATFIIAIVGVASILATACGSDTKNADSSSTASQASIEQLSARVQRNEMLFASVTLSSIPLHAIDESIAEGKAETTFVPTVRSVVRIFALTDWDASLKAEAEQIHGHAVDLLKALSDGDLAAAKDPSRELHEGYHQFADKVWAIVAKDLPADAGGVSQHDDHATPVTTTTP
jgi:hypothetical protein